MDSAGAVPAARAAAEHTRPLPVSGSTAWITSSSRSTRPVGQAGNHRSDQVPLHKTGPDEVGHHAGQEPLRDVHRGADAGDAQPPVAVVGSEREHCPHGIVAAPRELEAHGRSITGWPKGPSAAAPGGQRPGRTRCVAGQLDIRLATEGRCRGGLRGRPANPPSRPRRSLRACRVPARRRSVELDLEVLARDAQPPSSWIVGAGRGLVQWSVTRP